jgi:hypothetical protein
VFADMEVNPKNVLFTWAFIVINKAKNKINLQDFLKIAGPTLDKIAQDKSVSLGSKLDYYSVKALKNFGRLAEDEKLYLK